MVRAMLSEVRLRNYDVSGVNTPAQGLQSRDPIVPLCSDKPTESSRYTGRNLGGARTPLSTNTDLPVVLYIRFTIPPDYGCKVGSSSSRCP